MERYTEAPISMNNLINFVHNKLTKEKMDAMEIFLQKNEWYAEIVDSLIDIVQDHNFSLNATQQFLTSKPNLTTSNQLKQICLKVLEKKYMHLKQSTEIFEQQIKRWFTPAPPAEYGVALMGNDLKVLKPANEDSYDEIIQFNLAKAIPTNDELIVHIFESGNEKPVVDLSFKQTVKQFSIDAGVKKMHPGIYYWRLQLMESGKKAEGTFYLKPLFNVF